jgi:hypothetical protein
MKILNLVLTVIFFIFALLQLNDTPGDILFWFLIYAYTGFICAFAAFDKYNMWMILLEVLVLVYQIFRMFPAFSQWISEGCPSIVEKMQASTPFVELVREFLGLCICMSVMIFQYIRYTRWKKLKEV